MDLATRKVTNYTKSPNDYDEVEGISPDGQYVLIEGDKQNHQGPGHIDLWRLKFDGSEYKRFTFFNDYLNGNRKLGSPNLVHDPERAPLIRQASSTRRGCGQSFRATKSNGCKRCFSPKA